MEKPKRKPNRIWDYDYSQNGAYFVTICTQDRKKILSRISVGVIPRGRSKIAPGNAGYLETDAPTVELLWHGKIADKCIRQMDMFYGYLSIEQYVIMPDHIHLLIRIHGEPPGDSIPTRVSAVARFVGTFKRFCNKEYGENIWQSRYYDHVIRNQQDYNEIWEYIENNPTKWAITKDML